MTDSTMTHHSGTTPNAPEHSDKLVHDLADIIRMSLDDDQAQNTVTIDLSDKSAFADMMIISSGRSQRHVSAIAEHLLAQLKAHGYKDIRIEGVPNCDWVLIDAIDIIVHIFRPPVRSFYNLEKMWDPITDETIEFIHESH